MLMGVYRLAAFLHKTVDELQGMSLTEFYHWLAYLKVEPPEQGARERTAAVLATITNMSGRSLPQKKMVKPEDFLGGGKKQQTMEEQIAFMKGLSRG